MNILLLLTFGILLLTLLLNIVIAIKSPANRGFAIANAVLLLPLMALVGLREHLSTKIKVISLLALFCIVIILTAVMIYRTHGADRALSIATLVATLIGMTLAMILFFQGSNHKVQVVSKDTLNIQQEAPYTDPMTASFQLSSF